MGVWEAVVFMAGMFVGLLLGISLKSIAISVNAWWWNVRCWFWGSLHQLKLRIVGIGGKKFEVELAREDEQD